MKPFQFTLEAVRILRQRQEQLAMEQYARVLLSRQQAVQRLEAAERQIQTAMQEIRELTVRGCTASKAAHAQEYQRALEMHRTDCVRALELAERRANAGLNAMLQARREREIVDKFFDKQKARHLREQGRAEQKLLDDLASRRPASIFAWSPTGATS
jgi:flagellar export protein FliJ